MAGTETKAVNQENGIDYDSYVDCRGTEPMSRREKVLFLMSSIRTFCALLGALAQAIVLWKLFHPSAKLWHW